MYWGQSNVFLILNLFLLVTNSYQISLYKHYKKLLFFQYEIENLLSYVL